MMDAAAARYRERVGGPSRQMIRSLWKHQEIITEILKETRCSSTNSFAASQCDIKGLAERSPPEKYHQCVLTGHICADFVAFEDLLCRQPGPICWLSVVR